MISRGESINVVLAVSMVIFLCLGADPCCADRTRQHTKLASALTAVGAGYGAHAAPMVLLRNLWTRPNYKPVHTVYLHTH